MEEKKSGIKKFLEEFKAFAMRGNVLDMAVGVVIGGAFTAIVTALVEDIINPLIGLFFKADFSDVVIGLGGSSIKIGEFVNSIINFLIVALWCTQLSADLKKEGMTGRNCFRLDVSG